MLFTKLEVVGGSGACSLLCGTQSTKSWPTPSWSLHQNQIDTLLYKISHTEAVRLTLVQSDLESHTPSL